MQIRSPLQAQLVQWLVQPGGAVAVGQPLVILESMKMEHELLAEAAGTVGALFFAPGEGVALGDVLLELVAQTAQTLAGVPATSTGSAGTAPAGPRPELQALLARQATTLDASRPAAMQKRHALGLRSARENIADLCDAGSFIEYGALAIAAQRSRRSLDDLVQNTPADGMVTGIGSINQALFAHAPDVPTRCAVMAYDATVLAGTQGMRNHQKTDRLLGLAFDNRLPVVLFAEGGGGRPGDTDMPIVAGLHVATFASFARLSGQVPVVGIAAGRCFAGNAALLGCSDVIIATQGSNIGMGGPAMVEGGGLGVFAAEDIGPSSVQSANGVIDVLVADEAEAVCVARQYVSYFQGRTRDFVEPAAADLRDAVPANRTRAYDSRRVIAGVCDAGSVLALRSNFGAGIHTALARIAGWPIGVIANNPLHLGGAIDAVAADKAARFMQLCNAHGLPIASFIDTPGFMVGPDAEASAQVRHASRLFIVASALRVPFFSVVLRKGYGLGAMAMAAGSFHAPQFTAAWPTAEFGAMGLEGAVKLGFRKELAAVPEGPERQAIYEQLVASQYEKGSAINMATTLEIDAVIDPASTREWLNQGLEFAKVRPLSAARFVDAW